MDHTTCYIAAGILIPAVLALWLVWGTERKGRREDAKEFKTERDLAVTERIGLEKKHFDEMKELQREHDKQIKELKELFDE